MVASYGALASKLNVNTSTISEAVTGKRRPTVDTVARLMTELGDDVAGWLGFEYHGPWIPPAEVALLDGRQRRAIEELIRLLTEGGERGGDTPATKTRTRSDFTLSARKEPGRGPKGRKEQPPD